MSATKNKWQYPCWQVWCKDHLGTGGTVLSAFGPFAEGDKIDRCQIDLIACEILVYRTQDTVTPWRGKLS